LLASLVELEQRVREPERAPTRLRIVCECYTAYHWLPTALRALRHHQPGLEVTLAVEHTARPVAALEAGEIDAALLTTARVRRAELREQPLFSDEVAFVLSPKHALAAKRTLTPADLCATLLLTSNTPEAEARWFMASVFGRARPRLSIERLPLTEAVLDMARAGMGVAVLSEWMASEHLASGELVARRLAKGPLRRPWRLAWRRELGDAGPQLLRALAAIAPQSQLVGERRGALR
jgi:LysR family transcriptional regulator for metE and metH